jgi:hypothetical protein
MKREVAVIFLLMVVLVLAGCSSTEEVDCSSDDDCSRGYECVYNECVEEEEDDDEVAVETTSVADDEEEEEDDTASQVQVDCESDEDCNEGEGCTDDGDCEEDEVEGFCITDDECDEGEYCGDDSLCAVAYTCSDAEDNDGDELYDYYGACEGSDGVVTLCEDEDCQIDCEEVTGSLYLEADDDCSEAESDGEEESELDCGVYIEEEGACLASCASDEDCSDAYGCDASSACVLVCDEDETCGTFLCSDEDEDGEGLCLVSCSSDDACQDDYFCGSASGCVVCEADSECSDGFACTSDGLCEDACSDDGDCAVHYLCDATTAACESEGYASYGEACTSVSSCPDDYSCYSDEDTGVSGMCLIDCEEDGDCSDLFGSDYVCASAGYCVDSTRCLEDDDGTEESQGTSIGVTSSGDAIIVGDGCSDDASVLEYSCSADLVTEEEIDCGDNLCEEGVCLTSCVEHTDCSSGVCGDDGSCEECGSYADCSDGEICEEGSCTSYPEDCSYDSDCLDGFECVKRSEAADPGDAFADLYAFSLYPGDTGLCLIPCEDDTECNDHDDNLYCMTESEDTYCLRLECVDSESGTDSSKWGYVYGQRTIDETYGIYYVALYADTCGEREETGEFYLFETSCEEKELHDGSTDDFAAVDVVYCDDYSEGYTCIEGVCTTCEDDTDCGDDFVCNAGLCEELLACEYSGQCSSGQVCVEGKCAVMEEDYSCGDFRDTDNGWEDPEVKATAENLGLEDECLDSTYLLELHCGGGYTNNVLQVMYECADGCLSGVCRSSDYSLVSCTSTDDLETMYGLADGCAYEDSLSSAVSCDEYFGVNLEYTNCGYGYCSSGECTRYYDCQDMIDNDGDGYEDYNYHCVNSDNPAHEQCTASNSHKCAVECSNLGYDGTFGTPDDGCTRWRDRREDSSTTGTGGSSAPEFAETFWEKFWTFLVGG